MEGNGYEQSEANVALLLGILGILGCFILAPFAWVEGSRELKAIDAGRRNPAGRGKANAGMLLGVAGTGLGVIVMVVFVLPVLGIWEF